MATNKLRYTYIGEIAICITTYSTLHIVFMFSASLFPDNDEALLGKTKPKQAFRSTQKPFNKLPWN